jgi:UDP-N-acetylglucosamine--N-acetylmuramyl-(pentapeptide) pyrophosphoryl-undecaprenol N-acetylglucosamine transferase
MKTVLIAAGGTGGHIFPALAVANRLKEQGVDIFWVGSKRAMEQRLVQPHFDLTCLSIESLRGRSRWGWGLLPFRLLRSLFEAIRCVKRCKPDVVLTFGSFVSGPIGVASWLLSKPLVIHEQNAVSGMTNRWLAKISDRVLTAFSGSFPPAVQPFVIGNPVRQELLNLASPRQRWSERELPLRVLVLGGSQGSRAINNVILQWAERYALADEVTLWHQVGSVNYDEMKSAYSHLDVSVRVDAFIEDMIAAYTWADLVICRSGALTISEIMAVGIASVLVPFPHAVDDHQYKNAMFLVNAGAADVIRETDFTVENLNEVLQSYVNSDLSGDNSLLLSRAKLARCQAKPEATQHVIDIANQVVNEKNEKKAKC